MTRASGADAADRTSGRADAGGRALHWIKAGVGAPTVLLEAGLSASSGHWGRLFDDLAQTTQVVAYDRAGYGQSDAVATVDTDQIVRDLDSVLADAGASRPLILVGHSWGGALVRLYAAARPSDVAGLVLLDATHEDLASARSPMLNKVNAAATHVMGLQAKLGLRRRSLTKGKGEVGRLLGTVPPARRSEVIDELSRPALWTQARAELRSTEQILRHLHDVPVPDVPVVAVVGTKAARPSQARQRKELHDVYAAWLATLPDGHLVEAINSGHAVPFEDPELVADVVRGLIRTATP